MAQKAKARHIRGGVHFIPAGNFRRCFVQRRHGADGPGQVCGLCLSHPVGGADEPHAKGFGQDEFVPRAARIVGGEPARVHKAGDGKPILYARVGNGVPARQDASGLGHFFRAAAQDLPQHIQVHALGEADEVEGRLHLAAHRVHIAQGVGSGNLPKGVRVLDHGWKKVHRLHKGQIVCQAVNGRIVPAVVPHKEVRVFFAPGQLFQNAAQHPGPQLGRAAAPRAKHDLFFRRFCHATLAPLP